MGLDFRDECMKTTIEITDSLLDEAKRLAARERTTLRALIEEGLRHVLAKRQRSRPFKLRRVTFGGEGVDPALRSWEDVRRLAYEPDSASGSV